MVKKKIDERIRTLIENGIKTRHRSLIVCVGDKGRDVVVTLHFMLSKATVKTRPKVLWCYKKDLGFTSHRIKRQKKIKRDMERGLRQADEENPFELFVGSTDIKYTYYKDTHRILGNTFGMCVLQDFEALTPNILARTIETVEGGGLVVLLLNNMNSLKQLYTLTMDVHARFRTEAQQDVIARFNERFLLSLATCHSSIVIDDELNVLPISSHTRELKPLAGGQTNEKGDYVSEQDGELKILKADMKQTQPVGALLDCTVTLDQAKALLTFVEAISEKSLRSTIVLTAARGRGKSAALGFAIAGAVAYGYSNIFVTAPSPENLGTLFEMVFKAFDSLGIKEHQDYEALQSTNPEFHKAVIRVNIFREHRQTIQYIQPQDHAKLAQAELLVIDEAAAIPLPMVKSLLGPYLVFMSSTVNGYEGTGRSLSLKLVKQLRAQASATQAEGKAVEVSGVGARVLREITLKEPIRYAAGDEVERWLNDLLCLDCATKVPRQLSGMPHPSACSLFYVNRDTLFSFHKASENFLQRMMDLFVSSHYKNSPNDLQLMSDAPGHHLFVLIGPVAQSSTLPDILCAIQVCLEGQISRESVLASLARGKREAGDLVPWCISQQFQNNEFASLSGARIVRIATHPELARMGYGSRALELLSQYYEGGMANLSDKSGSESITAITPTTDANVLQTEEVAPRKNLPPLLTALSDRRPEGLHWLGVSFGLTLELLNFWNRAKFKPVYLRLTPNDITGEHTCIMIKPQVSVALQTMPNQNWLDSFHKDFKRRFLSLLAFQFSEFPTSLALSIAFTQNAPKENLATSELNAFFDEFDLKRLQSYAHNLVDYHMILDLLPAVARVFFLNRVDCSLSFTQAAILLALGLQHKSVTNLEGELGLPSNQILAQFNKAVRKISTCFSALQEQEVRQEIVSATTTTTTAAAPALPPVEPLAKEMKRTATETTKGMEEKQKQLLAGMNLKRYAIGGTDEDWDEALKGKNPGAGGVSVKSTREKTHKFEGKKRKA